MKKFALPCITLLTVGGLVLGCGSSQRPAKVTPTPQLANEGEPTTAPPADSLSDGQDGGLSSGPSDVPVFLPVPPLPPAQSEAEPVSFDGTPRLTEAFSDEAGRNSASCEADEVAVGLSCSGDYCDDLVLHCVQVGESLLRDRLETSPWVSTEGGAAKKDSKFVVKVECQGGYCNALRLTWNNFTSSGPRKTGECYETGLLSEENNERSSNQQICRFQEGYTFSGLTCQGAYCDDKTLRCCR